MFFCFTRLYEKIVGIQNKISHIVLYSSTLFLTVCAVISMHFCARYLSKTMVFNLSGPWLRRDQLVTDIFQIFLNKLFVIYWKLLEHGFVGCLLMTDKQFSRNSAITVIPFFTSVPLIAIKSQLFLIL